MTNPNWWDVEPYLNKTHCPKPIFHRGECGCEVEWYNIPAIIAEVEKRGETTAKRIEGTNDLFECSNCELPSLLHDARYCCDCGAKIIWS